MGFAKYYEDDCRITNNRHYMHGKDSTIYSPAHKNTQFTKTVSQNQKLDKVLTNQKEEGEEDVRYKTRYKENG